MMVETMLESSQDFGMSGGSLPQWKRELLQRRAARARPPPPPAPPAPPPPPPAPPDEDEELRYGPGIVKRLKSRYLSLALRDAPRRRPSVLRRAASLEHLLDDGIPPRAPPRPAPRPTSLVAPPVAPSPVRRDIVKRARSVDALSRLESREEPPSPPPLPAPRPPISRAPRPPRRPTPLLRETERPPPDVVRTALRKFETGGGRRAAPAARVALVMRGLELRLRCSTPEPKSASPSALSPSPEPTADISAIEPPEGVKQVSKAALDGIARAGSCMTFSFDSPKQGSHLPPVSATNPVLLGRARGSPPRRVGVIRPMPVTPLERAPPPPAEKPPPLPSTPPPAPPSPLLRSPSPRDYCLTSPMIIDTLDRREPTPEAIDDDSEPILKFVKLRSVDSSLSPNRESPPKIESIKNEIIEKREKLSSPPPPEKEKAKPLVNGFGGKKTVNGVASRVEPPAEEKSPWGSTLGARRAAASGATSVVFNFVSRKEVPDYIENDGVILRHSRKQLLKAGESGVVVLRADALQDSSEEEEVCAAPVEALAVRFVNDNVLINGRSSLSGKPNRDRVAKLKLQFDDSLTRTHEYPSEISLCEDDAPSMTSPSPPLTSPPPAAHAHLPDNTRISSSSLAQYTPSKTAACAFRLGVDAGAPPAAAAPPAPAETNGTNGDAHDDGAAHARWSEARALSTDLLF